jgi:hypothetical protein
MKAIFISEGNNILIGIKLVSENEEDSILRM